MKFSIVKNDYQKTISIAEQIKKNALAKGWTYDEENPDICLVVGGDGTFLTAVSKYNNQLDKVQFYPVLSGGIGFYTNHTQTNDNTDALKIEACGIQMYDALQVKVNDDVFYAINELKIMNDIKPTHLDMDVDNNSLEQFAGTGLIFSTASGSTGVMKSSGGAIIYPENGLFEMNEVAPVSTVLRQTINSPIVFSDQTIDVSKTDKGEDATLIIDSKIIINSFEKMQIKLQPRMIKVLRTKNNLEKAAVLKDIFVTSKTEK